MPTPIITAFSTGEISPLARGRVDVDKYPNACEEVTNFVITPLGTAMKCPGTAYVGTSKTDGSKIILIPVVYSSDPSYVLELGVGYIRFYKSNARLLFALVGWPPLPEWYELATPFTEADLINTDGTIRLKYYQSIDTVYLLNTNYMLQLQRFDDVVWGLTTLRLRDGPYEDTNTSTVKLTPSAASGTTHTIKGIAYGAGIYVEAGYVFGGNGYIHSSPDGITWTEEYAGAIQINSVKFLNNKFIAVGIGGHIITSSDGTTWVDRSGTSGTTDTLHDVAYQSVASVWVAVGVTGRIISSSDAITWTAVTVAGLAVDLYGVTSKGDNIVIVGNNKYLECSVTGTVIWSGDPPNDCILKGVTYNATLGRLYTSGDDGNIYYTDDITTTLIEVVCPIDVHINFMVNTASRTYAVGNDGVVIIIKTATAQIYSMVKIDPKKNIYGLCFGAASSLWCVGSNGMIWTAPTVDVLYDLKERHIVTKTLTASDEIFHSSDVGKCIRVMGTTNWGWGNIQAFTSKTVVTIDERENIAGTAATDEWRIGSFYQGGGFPAIIDMHEQRLVFANSQTRWASMSGDFMTFSPSELSGTVADSNATQDVISAAQHDEILWLKSGDVQLMGTSTGCANVAPDFAAARGIWRASGSSLDAPITPTDKNYKNQAATVVYVQKHGRKIADLIFDYNSYSYDSTDLTKLSYHITKPGIVKIAWQNEPFGILWALRSDGILVGMTHDRKQKFIAWWKRTFKDGAAKVEDFCIIPGTSQDQLWLSLKININGTVKRHMIYMKDFDFDSETIDFDQEEATLDPDAFFVDDGISYSGVLTSTIGSGYVGHLEGETVEILGNSLVQTNKVVASQSITLDAAVTKAQVGIPIQKARVKTVDLETAAQGNTSQGKIKRIQEIGIRIHEASTFKYGSAWTKLDTHTVTAGKVFTGDISKQFPSGYKGKANIYIESTGPVPCTIVCLMPRVEIYDR